MKKLYLYLILVVALLGIGAYFYFNKSTADVVKYRTDKTSHGDVVVLVRATGTINPVLTVSVGTQVSGVLARINVDFNSVVKKGQILAQIDSTFLSASVEEAQANLEHNKAQVTQATKSLNRTKEMFEKGLAAQADLDAAETAYASASADLKQTQAALDRAIVNLRYSTIKSPIDGVVISRDVDVGQTVAASLQAPELFSIGNDLTHMQVQATVDEADIGQIKEGQSVTFTVDAYADETFNGTVKQVRLAPVVTQNVVTYTVIIDVPNPDLKLRPGMTATVSILIDKRQDVLRIPTLALRFQAPSDMQDKYSALLTAQRPRPAADQQQAGEGQQQSDSSHGGKASMQSGKPHVRSSFIWIPDGKNGIKPIKVKLGLNDNRYVEVLEGDLKDGDNVIIGAIVSDASMAAGQTNPFAPARPGGGGGGPRGGR